MQHGRIVNQRNRRLHSWRAPPLNTLFDMHTFETCLREKYRKDTVKNGRKRSIFCLIDPILGWRPLAVSRFRAFALVASANNKGLEQVFDKILICSFYSLRGQFHSFFDKKKTRKHAFGRSVA